MKKGFKYVEAIWLGSDGKMSLRAVLAIAFSIDLIINFHSSGASILKALKLLNGENGVDANSLVAISSFLGNVAMINGIEAGLIAALLTLTTYQNTQSGLIKSTEITATEPQVMKQTTEAKGTQAVEQVKD